jgi:hypothetical protein
MIEGRAIRAAPFGEALTWTVKNVVRLPFESPLEHWNADLAA